MKCRSGRSAQGFWREGAGSAGLAGGGRYRAGGAKGSGGADNRADVAGILDTCEDDKKRRAGGRRSAQEVVERDGARLHEGGDTLGMFGVGETFEKAICGAEQREGNFGPIDERSEAFVMALTRFTE